IPPTIPVKDNMSDSVVDPSDDPQLTLWVTYNKPFTNSSLLVKKPGILISKGHVDPYSKIKSKTLQVNNETKGVAKKKVNHLEKQRPIRKI
ncbi:9733_t:CDS:2, partial [Cetraspora pellucida]